MIHCFLIFIVSKSSITCFHKNESKGLWRMIQLQMLLLCTQKLTEQLEQTIITLSPLKFMLQWIQFLNTTKCMSLSSSESTLTPIFRLNSKESIWDWVNWNLPMFNNKDDTLFLSDAITLNLFLIEQMDIVYPKLFWCYQKSLMIRKVLHN